MIGVYGGGAPALTSPPDFSSYNEVTFIYAGADGQSPVTVSVIGTFDTLYNPIPMRRAIFEDSPSRYFSADLCHSTGTGSQISVYRRWRLSRE